MATTSKGIRLLLQALVILVFMSSTFTAITLEQLQDSFYLEMNSDFGGSCNRDYEDEAMLPKVLQAFEDAWLLSSDGIQLPENQIGARSENDASARTFARLRGLLFIFFGIQIRSNGQFEDDGSPRAYNNVLSKSTYSLRFDEATSMLILTEQYRRVFRGRCSPG